MQFETLYRKLQDEFAACDIINARPLLKKFNFACIYLYEENKMV